MKITLERGDLYFLGSYNSFTCKNYNYKACVSKYSFLKRGRLCILLSQGCDLGLEGWTLQKRTGCGCGLGTWTSRWRSGSPGGGEASKALSVHLTSACWHPHPSTHTPGLLTQSTPLPHRSVPTHRSISSFPTRSLALFLLRSRIWRKTGGRVWWP